MDSDRIGWEVDETYSEFCPVGGRNITGAETKIVIKSGSQLFIP
jgi:hypothetical protein